MPGAAGSIRSRGLLGPVVPHSQGKVMHETSIDPEPNPRSGRYVSWQSRAIRPDASASGCQGGAADLREDAR